MQAAGPFQIGNDTVCAGHIAPQKGGEICNMETGSALIAKGIGAENDRLVGLTSFVPGPTYCSDKNFAALYTNPQFYFDWIKETMKKDGFDWNN